MLVKSRITCLKKNKIGFLFFILKLNVYMGMKLKYCKNRINSGLF